MKPLIFMILAVTSCLGCADANPPDATIPEKEHNAFLKLIEVRVELAKVLKKITDEDTANQMIPEYAKLQAEMKACTKETGRIPIKVKKPIRKLHRDELNSSISELNQQFIRVAQIPGVESLLRAKSK